MSDIETAATVAGIVAAIRRACPLVDGLLVYAVVIVVSSAVCVAQNQDATLSASMLRALQIAVKAIAAVSVAGYVAEKSGKSRCPGRH